ncbi:hypothetical protein BESB_022200 [Besnoitia besnoiti]|uniref:Secreted protein n=1 Tax=Besnoitia besnoiti TaxID=94643 RepID=A0A2A9LZ94_BESBE|nr:hypothetical protein BESB_022200 [Besnoitia besnoiti]PFH31728.1 hypothetical protein BESB_022200 [Besnoitia besnoiti]
MMGISRAVLRILLSSAFTADASFATASPDQRDRRIIPRPLLPKTSCGSQGARRPPAEWPSGLRRCVKAAVRKGVGSNPTSVRFSHFLHL